MAKQQFKAEAQRLLDLMINSIYTNREIFIRELISNASDAIDKLYYRSLTDGNTGVNRDDFGIDIKTDKEARTVTISDNGIGMTKEELENNLGTIAKSGSLNFKQNMDKNEEIDIIGQFGVGFYSAFMVAKNVKVVSKAFGEETAWCWESSGLDGFTVSEAVRDANGTTITMTLKDNTDDDNYDEFLNTSALAALVRKYSDYIRYPIRMDMIKYTYDEEAKESVEGFENRVVNSMVPIWKKQKSELKQEDYNNFFRDKFFEFSEPYRTIHFNTEGAATFNALLFVPGQVSPEYYTRSYKRGLKLYSNGVMIMEQCEDLLPEHFSFVRGLVDSQDLSLNISREMLQQDRQLQVIAGRIEKKVKSELVSMLKNDRDKYEKFFKDYGFQLKYGCYNDYGTHKDFLQELIMFYSSTEKKLVTLEEYCARMKEDQKYIYYARGESIEKIEKMPQLEAAREKGYEILYMTENIDEFCAQSIFKVDDKEFRSVSSVETDTADDETKAALEKEAEDKKDVIGFIKETLNEKVKDVRLSARLKSYPVCLTSEGMISLEMEKMFSDMPGEQKVKAERILEINPNHAIYKTLCTLHETDKDKLKLYADILYTQASLVEGLAPEDPVAYSNAICDLLADKM